MTATDYDARLNRHYAPDRLENLIFDGLRRLGKDPQRFSYEDLAPLDQFHSRGKAATVELARAAGLEAGMEVLDVGGGLGGPARTLAAEFGCRVTVVDLTEAYCRVGELLTARTGLSDRVSFHCGSALELPFTEARFDAVWTQHCSMNIEDKGRLYGEAYRVLRSGGRLATYEIVAGPVQPIHFPVPWATEPELSFLVPAASLRSLIEQAGFRRLDFRDKSQEALAWFRERLAAAPAAPPPLGLHLLLGARFRPAFANILRNLEEQRIEVVQGVYAKP